MSGPYVVSHQKVRWHVAFSGYLTSCLAFLLVLGADQTRAIEKEQLITTGLRDRVEIIRDQWGIAHIYAENQKDLFFAQGYNAARDRLFQFEMWRRRALGLLSEIQGEKALQHDIGARLLKFRGDIQAEMNHVHEDGEEIITSFIKGVNSYIESTRQNPELLPVEFSLLGIEPGFWTPEVVLSRHNALTSGAEDELLLAELVNTIGPQRTEQLLPFPSRPHLTPKPSIELGDLGREILATYEAARTPPKFAPEDIAISSARNPNQGITSLNESLYPPFDTLQNANSVGSNNWIISGSNTASGYPILANDPHRLIDTPSVRYWTHLVAPGWNVIGGGEPTLPGIAIGHNEHGAWGLTIFVIDQEDLYVYEVNPDNPNQYRYQGGWEDMQVISDEIPVKNRAPEKVKLKYTRHGPILYEDREKNRAYALRAAWLDSGATPYLPTLRLNQASTWQEFREACTYIGLPGENMIWADKEGNIGWQAVGLAPLRIGWDGTLPVPGDGSYEWAGYAPIKSLPHVLNPAEGHWQSANQYNVPKGYPNIYSLFWADPFRFNRIQEVLQAGENLSISDSMALQNDEVSIPARSLVPLLVHLKPKNELVAVAVHRLLNWDYKMSKTSVAAAIYAEWEKQLQKGLLDLVLPSAKSSLVSYLSRAKMTEWLNSPESFFENDPIQERNRLLAESFDRVVKNLINKLGVDMSSWQYGQEQLNHMKLRHPLSQALNAEYQRELDIGVVPKGGNSTTVNLSVGVGNFGQTIGPGFRMIVDTKDWDLAVGASVPGQSGDPASPHYDDLLDMWINGEYFPAYYSREKIEAVAEKKIYLVPPQMMDEYDR